MPATVRLFSEVDRPPGRLFADTSFVTTLLEWALTPTDPRCAAAYSFFQRIRSNNCVLWTTPFTAEEILWRYVRGALFEAMAPHGLNSVAEFKRVRREDYAWALVGCRPQLRKMLSALN